MILQGLSQMLRGKIEVDVVGPVGMVHIVGEAARIGVFQLLYIAALISINLGLFNLFPIPALDGGRAIFLVAEMLRGKPVEPEKEGLIHLLVLPFNAFDGDVQDIRNLFIKRFWPNM